MRNLAKMRSNALQTLFGVGVEPAPDSTPPRSKATVLQFPQPRPVEGVLAPEGYASLAQALDFKPTDLVLQELRDFFRAEGIKLYDYEEVNRWMRRKRREAGCKSWHWAPLRERDRLNITWRGTNAGDHGAYELYGFWCDGHYAGPDTEVYARLVPDHALEKVLRIQRRFRRDVAFFVTEYTVRQPDPFIGVRPRSLGHGSAEDHMLIFDAWDEPGFGGPSEDQADG